MNVVTIAWRGLHHRGLGSLLTILSMALGVMLVVAVLTIHGVISQSFRANSSFGYNVIIGSRGGGMQLTLNTVYYLSRPLEPVPFEYFLMFRDQATREPYLRNSIGYRAHVAQQQSLATIDLLAGVPGLELAQSAIQSVVRGAQDAMAIDQLGLRKDGDLADWAETVIPLTLGDYFSRDMDQMEGSYRVVGTTAAFFTDLVLDAETRRRFEFGQGRALRDFDPEHGYFEAVVGSQVARDAAVSLNEIIYPIHGEPGSSGAHTHEQGFTIVGILDPTGTAHDRAVFVNIEGFYLMDDHAKPIEEGRDRVDEDEESDESTEGPADEATANANLLREPLPMEQREITALLLRSNEEDGTGIVGDVLIQSINNGGFLEPSLAASQFRPILAQTAPQAVNPIGEITNLFQNIVDPIRWVLLGLTILVCIVSGISILVGIYNSMAQRRHEIAVLRALGARRGHVTQIVLAESILLSLAGGLVGWIAGHALNAMLSPAVEAKSGVRIGFFDFAPAVPLAEIIPLGNSTFLQDLLQYCVISPEFLLIPGMIGLAILVGVYPAISAYRTDVSKSLGS